MCFEELVKRISPTLKRITRRLGFRQAFLGGEDLFQEALVHLWQDSASGKLDGKTDSYILQGCYFYLKNYLRKAGDKARLVSLQDLVNEDDEGSGLLECLCLEERNQAQEEIESKNIVEEIMNDGLTQREKDVFSLCLEGLTVREIAARIKVSHVMVVKIEKNIRLKVKRFFE